IKMQACLRPRDRFWDIPVPKIDSAFDNLFVPQPSWSPSTTQQLRKLVAAPYLSPNDWTPRSNAYFASPLALCARRVSSAASRLLGTTSLRFALHGWQRKNLQTELSLARILLDELIDPATLAALIKEQEKALEEARADLEALSKPEIFGVEIKAAENKIQGEKNKLASLKDQAIILNEKLQKTAANQELIKDQIKELETQIKEAMNLQKSAAQNVKNETQAMAQLMIDSEVQQNRKWLAKLKERLFITLENDKAAIQKQLEDNRRAQELQQEHIAQAEAGLKKLTSSNELDQNKLRAIVAESEANITKLANDQKRKIAEQQETIGELQGKLDNFVETRAVVEPLLSTRPTSTPKRVILLIAIFLGGILGVIAVFFAELREKVRRSLVEESNTV
ncbi:hypothetical protein, partial [Thiolapillus sp.]|uniref:hypothetical protein n=1 Tax=Thiolapillus sp. TaxID=2017437 RepID=UPI003AF6A5C5